MSVTDDHNPQESSQEPAVNQSSPNPSPIHTKIQNQIHCCACGSGRFIDPKFKLFWWYFFLNFSLIFFSYFHALFTIWCDHAFLYVQLISDVRKCETHGVFEIWMSGVCHWHVEVKYIEAVKITIYSAVEVTAVDTSDIATSFSQDSVGRWYEIRLACLAKLTSTWELNVDLMT